MHVAESDAGIAEYLTCCWHDSGLQAPLAPRHQPYTSFFCSASDTASVRLEAPSLRSTELTWNFTVESLTKSVAAICGVRHALDHQREHLALALGEVGPERGCRRSLRA